jgi:hypothetical protein
LQPDKCEVAVVRDAYSDADQSFLDMALIQLKAEGRKVIGFRRIRGYWHIRIMKPPE